MAAFTLTPVRLVSGATARAISSTTGTFVSPRYKDRATVLADSLLSTSARTNACLTEGFIVFDAAPSKNIADSARGNEVLRTIIKRIAIEMISEESALRTATSSDEPVEFSSTPETGMRTPADFVKENRPRFGNHPVFPSKRMR